MATTAVLVVAGGAVVLLLLVLLALLLRALGSASRTITTLGTRLEQLEGRTGRLQEELAGLDEGLGDVAAALREHRPSDAPGTDGPADHSAEAPRREPR